MYTSADHGSPLNSVERAAIVEEFWASRNAWAESMNAERRLAWERKWAGIGESDLGPSHTRQIESSRYVEQPLSRVLVMRRRSGDSLEDMELAKVPAYRFYWQPKSLQIPMP
ncbi:MAG TPA: hypothetical protein VHW69_10660 [Rhizomicrobium sp.]|jgi:hypothetical protein|nr:hypothetical protein [Rhizomicrobium sp.]